MARIALGVVWLAAVLAGGQALRADELIVEAGARAREGIVVRAPLPEGHSDSQAWALVDAETGQKIPAQTADGTLLFLLERPLQAGQKRSYRLQKAGDTPRSREMECLQTDQHLEIRKQGRPVLSYHVAVSKPPAELDPVYRRSGHIHPVQTPKGRVITAEFPPDHAHQHGLFSAWVRTQFEGREVDFWNQKGNTGTVEHRRVLSTRSGPVVAGFTVELASVALRDGDDRQDALLERWDLQCFRSGAGHLFEIATRQEAAGTSPLRVLEYHYGGMAVRGTSDWLDQKGCEFLTSEGLGREPGNHSRPRWVTMHGKLQGEPCGMAVFCHPESFRAPQPVRLHPSKPYFVFSPPVEGPFEIAAGEPYRARYLYYVYDGTPDTEHFERIWHDWTDPPRAVWKKSQASR